MPEGGTDSFACTRRVRDVLVGLPEANSALVGLLFWVGFRREIISFPRSRRTSGKSGWTFKRKFRYAFDTAFAFSDLPITMMLIAGAVGIGGALVAGAAVLIAWALGAIDVRGYTPLMLAGTVLVLHDAAGARDRRRIRLAHLREHQRQAGAAGAFGRGVRRRSCRNCPKPFLTSQAG